MEVVQNIALISINATMVVQLVSFLIFMAVFNRIMIRPLRAIMNERRSVIQKVGDDLTAAGEAFDQIADQIERQEADARSAALKIRDKVENEGRQSVADLLGRTREEISGLQSAAQSETLRKLAEARENIQSEAELIADRMITALLGTGRVA